MTKEKGFTLIELMVVIAIIAILAAVVAPNAFKAIEKAKAAGVTSDFKAIKTAALGFYADCGVWPENGHAPAFMSNLDLASNPITGWDGPYLERWPTTSPWGASFVWVNDAGTFINSNAGNERFVSIGSVPQKAAEKIDLNMDGSSGVNVGVVRYTAAFPTTLQILVSADNP